MKILVTGAKGQVGSALSRLAMQRSLDIISMDSRDMDITSPVAIDLALERYSPDFIVNAAAYTAVDKAEQEPERAFLVNGIAPGYLAQAASNKGVPMVHISTDYVFNGHKEGAYGETDSVAPLGVYGLSKLQGEKAVATHLDQHIILRTSWVFGLEGSNFPKTILRLAKERSEIGVVADQYGRPTFADDIAVAVLAIAGRYQRDQLLPWGLYHYAGDEACSWYDLANLLLQRAHTAGLIQTLPQLKRLATDEYPTRAQRPANSVLDCRHFQACFSDIPLSDWKKGINSIIAFMK